MKLAFFENVFGDFILLDWPKGKPTLQAYLAADIREVRLANISFIIANTPPGHRIYFAAGSAHRSEHENMKKRLSMFGELFEEKVKVIAKVGVGLFRRRTVEKNSYFVFGSTDKRDVIAAVFDSYNLAWCGEGWSFIFFVASQEPPGWMEKRNRSSIHRRGSSRRASPEQPLHNEDSV